MSVCCCSLAGTAACKHCPNNPNAEPSPYKTVISTGTSLPLNYENRIPWDEFNPEKLYFFDEQWAPVNISCPKCGNQIQRKEDIVLTTYPPKRQYRCPVCGWEGVK